VLCRRKSKRIELPSWKKKLSGFSEGGRGKEKERGKSLQPAGQGAGGENAFVGDVAAGGEEGKRMSKPTTRSEMQERERKGKKREGKDRSNVKKG